MQGLRGEERETGSGVQAARCAPPTYTLNMTTHPGLGGADAQGLGGNGEGAKRGERSGLRSIGNAFGQLRSILDVNAQVRPQHRASLFSTADPNSVLVAALNH